MSIALSALVQDLVKRVEALEQTLAAPLSKPRRGRSNADRQADGTRLRTAIEEILSAHPDYSAKHVLKALAAIDLGRQALPSVRTVQWHTRAVRNTNCIARA